VGAITVPGAGVVRTLWLVRDMVILGSDLIGKETKARKVAESRQQAKSVGPMEMAGTITWWVGQEVLSARRWKYSHMTNLLPFYSGMT
jgi:hypothetical protein